MSCFAGLLLACAAQSAMGSAQSAMGAEGGESWTLFQGLNAHPRLDFSLPSGPCESAAARLAAALPSGFTAALEPGEHDPGAVRVCVGAPLDPALEPLALRCGLEPFEGGFRFLGREYTAPGDALVSVFEDPERAGQPLCLVLGNDLEALAVYLDVLPRLTRPYLWLYADGEPALECPLALDGAPRLEHVRDYVARREEYFAAASTLEFEGLHVHARNPPDLKQWRAYGLALAGVRKRIALWFGTQSLPTVELYLYEHLEDFEWCLGTSALSLPSRLRPRVHALLAAGMPDDAGAGLARALARTAGGSTQVTWLEDGLALSACGHWWQRPLDEWIATLALAKLLPGPGEVLAADAGARWSEHVLQPARALLFERVMTSAGGDPRRLRALWKGADPEAKKIGVLYQRGVLEVVQNMAKGKAASRVRGAGGKLRAERLAALPLRHGVALVETPDGGYSARAAGEALSAARALGPGADAVSLTVLAGAEDPAPPCATLAPRSVYGSANDLALASACAAARGRDMRVLFALEVLAQPSGAWADVRTFTGDEDWQQFFRRYEQVALHYALLAELLRVELFSFGANLRESTRTEPQGPVQNPALVALKTAGWKALIAKLRGAYDGGLTYTARFPAEAAEVGFFEHLDFVGLSFFPRLAREERAPTPEELRRTLRAHLQQALDLAVRWNKPLLLVQTGFPARDDSWNLSFVPRGASDPAPQELYVEALQEALAQGLENQAALRGFYLWSWPVAAPAPGREAGAFALRGRPAEAALGRLFAR
ncbi:MAG: hypothetical protein EXS08_03225 [Planctomycetes bacterium]|nr:hypothetical protein [Planctomycetota bacterium]